MQFIDRPKENHQTEKKQFKIGTKAIIKIPFNKSNKRNENNEWQKRKYLQIENLEPSISDELLIFTNFPELVNSFVELAAAV